VVDFEQPNYSVRMRVNDRSQGRRSKREGPCRPENRGVSVDDLRVRWTAVRRRHPGPTLKYSRLLRKFTTYTQSLT